MGIVSLSQALKLSENSGLDLVEISPNTNPPVCRLMDYGKYLFDQKKKLAASRKNQKVMQVKEIKLRPVTGEGDYKIKINRIRSFLESGDKVKVTMRFRGRELAHMDIGFNLMQKICNEFKDKATLEHKLEREGQRSLIMVFVPLKNIN